MTVEEMLHRMTVDGTLRQISKAGDALSEIAQIMGPVLTDQELWESFSDLCTALGKFQTRVLIERHKQNIK